MLTFRLAIVRLHHINQQTRKSHMYNTFRNQQLRSRIMDEIPVCSAEIANLASAGGADTDANSVHVADEIKNKWETLQVEYKSKLMIEDIEEWSKNWDNSANHEDLQYVGGVDISFVKGDNVNACAAFVVLNFPDLEVVYEDLSMVQLTAPYIPGFLAFREADFLVEKIKKLREQFPEVMPQVTLIDGNGILHPRGFGLASQMGVLCDIPTIGVAKNFYHVDGMEKDEEHHNRISSLKNTGDTFDLVGASGTLWGQALKTSPQSTKPVFVSPGHKISVATATKVVQLCSKVRVPEPTRQADIRSREYLRDHWKQTPDPDVN